MAKKHYASDSRRDPERQMSNGKMGKRSGGMIEDDMRAPALCPEMIMSKYFAPTIDSTMSSIDDLYDGVQKSMQEDHRDMKKAFKPKHL